MGFDFLDLHKSQLKSSGVPECHWDALKLKLEKEIFDAGDHLRIVKVDHEDERGRYDPAFGLQALHDISKDDPQNIFLIDHCWTYKASDLRKQLMENEYLRRRLVAMFDFNNSQPQEKLVQDIYDYSWKVSGMYTITSNAEAEDRVPIWYIMDEVGTAVCHSVNANCRIVPFVYLPEQTTYSLLFFIKDLDKEDIVFRDYAEFENDPIKKSAALLCWQPKDFTSYSTEAPIQGSEYYLSGHIKETLPKTVEIKRTEKTKYKVFSQYQLIYDYLKDERFELVDSEDEADILWYIDHFRDFEKLSDTPDKLVNQFPYEYVITVKDLLCMTCRRHKNDDDDDDDNNDDHWFPITYNLKIEVQHFLSYFQQREKKGLDNYWICKPYNLARGLDMYITNNIDLLMRMPETGPKIVQKYITNPVLFHRDDIGERVKFDIRYVLLLKSTKPLKAYAYKQFFLRFANKSFSLSDFDVYDKHFTVMNYQEGIPLAKILAKDFKDIWAKQYSNYPWDTIEKSILKMFREIFECAVQELPPCGIAASPQSRALYAADIMLHWTNSSLIQPKILEINFAPDCKRACEYYPDFYNNIFQLLFLDEESDEFFEL